MQAPSKNKSKSPVRDRHLEAVSEGAEAVSQGAEAVSQGVEAVSPQTRLSAIMSIEVKTGELNHHNAMLRFGLIGSAIGFGVGTWLMPQIPHREAIYPVIMPMATTFFGLVAGLFSAGVRKAILREGTTEQDLRNGSAIQIIFANFDEAEQRITALRDIGVGAGQLTIVAEDSDEMRTALAPLYKLAFNRMIVTLGLLGTVLGAAWGIIGCAQMNLTLPSAAISATMAAFCGSLLGFLTGSLIGGVLQVDNGPATDATIIEGSVLGGVMAVTILATDEEQREKILEVIRG